MRDQLSIERLVQLHPKFRISAQDFIEEVENTLNLTFRIDQGFRSFAQQTAIYAEGRTKLGINCTARYPLGQPVTYSPAGTSYHNYGIAIDIVPVNPDGSINWKFNYNSIRSIAVKYGMGLGIDFPHPDYDHFENRYGLNWRDLLHKYTIKDFIDGTEFVNI